MADMTIEETVKFFISKTVDAHGGKASDYFCAMTNNRERRRMEQDQRGIRRLEGGFRQREDPPLHTSVCGRTAVTGHPFP